MRLIHLLRFFLYLRYFFHRLSRTGSFTPNHSLRFDTEPYRTQGKPVKDLLHHFQVKQFHESSCSVASVASVVNTLARHQGISAGLKTFPITQQDLLDQVQAAHWKERMGPNGYKGRRGLPLDILGEVVKASLDTFGIAYSTVEVLQAPAHNHKTAEPLQRQLKALLKIFETRGRSIIIAHFDQGSFLRELNIPHISPVGGYDPQTQKVKILDVDAEIPHPYEIPFHTFYRGISTGYQNLFRGFGYGRGGCVVIRL
ncbi:MAG: phytochelatin synthase family protein [Desulfobacterales bacterium]|nr:phytochelatin synthase family protein [Desulfobacterales bacterium]